MSSGPEPVKITFVPGFTMARSRRSLADALREIREQGLTVALVPTMGYLHEGHLSLVDVARRHADVVAMSIFVNPMQFGEGEDLDRYPRDMERDVKLAMERGVGLVFAPPREEMYPGGEPVVTVDPGALAERLCGTYRPGHFHGVVTVVAKLFGLMRPDVAVFGRKDYQQAVLVRRMVRDLNLPVEVQVGPLVREPDGLAMSSRNAYLSDDERAQAVGLFEALEAADAAFRAGEGRPEVLLDRARSVLASHPLVRPQYLELVDPETLEPLAEAREGAVLAAAAHLGSTRIIDNLILGAGRTDPRARPDSDASGRGGGE